ncbi:MAG: hypothetical protein ABFS30_17670, partial [Pseudomonadota bacterium]
SFDDPVHAPLGLPAADAYSEIAPNAAHAQHMTLHIFVAMGLWDRVIKANIRSTRIQDTARAADGGRPLCCGRTFLAAGLVEEARTEARRTIEAVLPHIEAGRAIIGLEPSCLLTLRDEFTAILPGAQSQAVADKALMFEEFLGQENAAGRLDLPLGARPGKALLHGHCHQKAFAVMPAVEVTARSAQT